MSLLRRIFPREVPAADIALLAQRLAIAPAAPAAKRLRRIFTSKTPRITCDWMDWSIWQDKQNEMIWIQCSGGVANTNIWYGPGEPSALATMGSHSVE